MRTPRISLRHLMVAVLVVAVESAGARRLGGGRDGAVGSALLFALPFLAFWVVLVRWIIPNSRVPIAGPSIPGAVPARPARRLVAFGLAALSWVLAFLMSLILFAWMYFVWIMLLVALFHD